MEAKDMFEEIGFIYDDSIQDEINYFNKRFISDTNVISFNLKLKRVTAFVESDSPFTPNRPYTLNLKELQAINQQMKEIGDGK